jgi:hypothetical protein
MEITLRFSADGRREAFPFLEWGSLPLRPMRRQTSGARPAANLDAADATMHGWTLIWRGISRSVVASRPGSMLDS